MSAMASTKKEDEDRAEFYAMLSDKLRRLPFRLNLWGRRIKTKTSRVRVA